PSPPLPPPLSEAEFSSSSLRRKPGATKAVMTKATTATTPIPRPIHRPVLLFFGGWEPKPPCWPYGSCGKPCGYWPPGYCPPCCGKPPDGGVPYWPPGCCPYGSPGCCPYGGCPGCGGYVIVLPPLVRRPSGASPRSLQTAAPRVRFPPKCERLRFCLFLGSVHRGGAGRSAETRGLSP